MEKQFAKKLLSWFGTGKRDMPWKKTKDPYRIWISEVILQQTQVKQGLSYYLNFIETFPDVKSLAEANEEAVLACWKGLGYYSRARNLHRAAQYIQEDCQGVFPDSYDTLLKLKGVGPYSAAAIASFAYDLPHAVADGNVYRVLSRVFGVQESIDQLSTKKALGLKANELLDRKRPADFNQAIMDLGALVCSPRNPICSGCPFEKTCVAFQKGLIGEIPKRDAKRKKKARYFHYFVLEQNNAWLMHRRVGKDIWEGLYQFPLIETQSSAPLKSSAYLPFFQDTLCVILDIDPEISKTHSQNLTHQKIYSQFYRLNGQVDIDKMDPMFKFIDKKDIHNIAVPKSIDWYLNDKRITLF